MRADYVAPTRTEVEELSQEVMTAFNEVIFDPLRNISGVNLVENSINDIVADFKQDKIKFENGVLKGKFSVASLRTLDDLNQEYDKNRRGFIITDPNIQYQLAKEQSQFIIAKTSALALLKQFDIISLGVREQETNKIIDTIASKSKDVVKSKGELVIPTPDIRGIKASFHDAINKSFEAYSDLVVQKLTDDINEANSFKQMNDSITLRYQQTERKAYNMSDDQSHFFGGEARRKVYTDNGATSFVWKTKGDNKVRDSHRHLNGMVFQYADPPIVDGVQSLPSEPFGCRCIDIPIYKKKGNQQ